MKMKRLLLAASVAMLCATMPAMTGCQTFRDIGEGVTREEPVEVKLEKSLQAALVGVTGARRQALILGQAGVISRTDVREVNEDLDVARSHILDGRAALALGDFSTVETALETGESLVRAIRTRLASAQDGGGGQ